MKRNVFLENGQELDLSDYMKFGKEERKILGSEIPIMVYRLMEFSLREEIISQCGKEKQIEIFRKAGRRAGTYIAQHLLDLSLPFNEFIAQLQARIEEMKMGILRVEAQDGKEKKLILTVSEDADCSGMPLLGEAVCNYDEGLIAGILSAYSNVTCQAVEVDCWGTGSRVCRFRVEALKKEGWQADGE